jgi:hypothetical protein
MHCNCTAQLRLAGGLYLPPKSGCFFHQGEAVAFLRLNGGRRDELPMSAPFQNLESDLSGTESSYNCPRGIRRAF